MEIVFDWLSRAICVVLEWLAEFQAWELIYAAFGAFLGFTFAVHLDKRSKKEEAQKKKISLLKNVSLELQDAVDNLPGSTTTDSFVIDIPVYEALVQSGAILDFVEDSFYVDLMKAYLDIKILKELEKAKEKDETEIMKSRDEVIKKASNLIPRIDKLVSRLEKKSERKTKKEKNI